MQACLLTVPKYFQQIMGFLKKNFEVEVTCSTVQLSVKNSFECFSTPLCDRLLWMHYVQWR